jgi:hypothetical protein
MDETEKLYKMVEMQMVKVHCEKCSDYILDVTLADGEDIPKVYCHDCYETISDKLKDADKEINSAIESLQNIDVEER